MRKVLVGILAIGLLAGCSEATTSDTPATHVTKEAPKVDQAKLDIQAMSEYSKKIIPIVDSANKVLNALTDMATIGASDPASLTSPEFIDTANKIEAASSSVATDIRNIDPGDNAKVNEVQGYMLKVADDFDFIAENYTNSIIDLSSDEVNVITAHIVDINQNIQAASSVVKQVSEIN